jgi:hypothetical protein
MIPSLGVICLLTRKQRQSDIAKMKNANRVVVLFDEKTGAK